MLVSIEGYIGKPVDQTYWAPDLTEVKSLVTKELGDLKELFHREKIEIKYVPNPFYIRIISLQSSKYLTVKTQED